MHTACYCVSESLKLLGFFWFPQLQDTWQQKLEKTGFNGEKKTNSMHSSTASPEAFRHLIICFHRSIFPTCLSNHLVRSIKCKLLEVNNPVRHTPSHHVIKQPLSPLQSFLVRIFGCMRENYTSAERAQSRKTSICPDWLSEEDVERLV